MQLFGNLNKIFVIGDMEMKFNLVVSGTEMHFFLVLLMQLNKKKSYAFQEHFKKIKQTMAFEKSLNISNHQPLNPKQYENN